MNKSGKLVAITCAFLLSAACLPEQGPGLYYSDLIGEMENETEVSICVHKQNIGPGIPETVNVLAGEKTLTRKLGGFSPPNLQSEQSYFILYPGQNITLHFDVQHYFHVKKEELPYLKSTLNIPYIDCKLIALGQNKLPSIAALQARVEPAQDLDFIENELSNNYPDWVVSGGVLHLDLISEYNK